MCVCMYVYMCVCVYVCVCVDLDSGIFLSLIFHQFLALLTFRGSRGPGSLLNATLVEVFFYSARYLIFPLLSSSPSRGSLSLFQSRNLLESFKLSLHLCSIAGRIE